ncbi:hypothetical protein ACFY7Z_10290 [Streptomyces sp. NPDC012623]
MTGQETVNIPGLCFIPHPDDALRCTEYEGHGKSRRPGDEGEKQ